MSKNTNNDSRMREVEAYASKMKTFTTKGGARDLGLGTMQMAGFLATLSRRQMVKQTGSLEGSTGWVWIGPDLSLKVSSGTKAVTFKPVGTVEPTSPAVPASSLRLAVRNMLEAWNGAGEGRHEILAQEFVHQVRSNAHLMFKIRSPLSLPEEEERKFRDEVLELLRSEKVSLSVTFG